MDMTFSTAVVYMNMIGYEKLPWNDPWHIEICTRSEVMEMAFDVSAEVYSDLIIRLAMQNYPQMTLQLPKSIHWI